MTPRSGKTRVESWLAGKLVGAFTGLYQGTTTLKMPHFQRGVVWSPSKQADLIRSLKQGFPVGSLLFFKQPAQPDGVTIHLLIDGLQRTTAIREYTQRPLAFMSLEDVDKEAILELAHAMCDALDEEISSGEVALALGNWMSMTKTLKETDGFDAVGLIEQLNQRLSPDKPAAPKGALLNAAREFLQVIRDECDIGNIELPVLFYEGKQSELPDIFDRINATGTKLTKYQIFAASWVEQDIVIANVQVLDAIKKRYSTLMSRENISIAGVKADGTPEHLSLFDYLFGLGKYLSDKFPLLFGSNSDAVALESVVFALATVGHRLQLSEMKELPRAFYRNKKNTIDATLFEKALLESVLFVNRVLAPYIELKLNSESALSGGAHTDLQIASMIARAISGSYDPVTWAKLPDSKADRKQLALALPQHYLVDVLQQNWKGSGDSRLFRMVWDTTDDGEESSESEPAPSRHYLQRFSAQEFDGVLGQWFADQIKLSQRSRAYVTSAAKLFLKYVYTDTLTVKEEKKTTFELDHIFPVSRLVGPATADTNGWPISAVSNLALFDWETNREKSKHDLAQYLAKIPAADRAKRRKAIERLVFLKVESAAIPRDKSGRDQLTREQFVAFLEERFAEMKLMAMRALGISA